MHMFMVWLSILESCQVYVVFVFMGALRINSSLDTWEIECISYEALSVFILELIDYLAMFEMLGWFSWLSWIFNSLHVGCCPFLEIHWEICNCFCVCLFLFNVSRCVPCFAFSFCLGVQKAKCGGIWCVIIFSYFSTLFVIILIID